MFYTTSEPQFKQKSQFVQSATLKIVKFLNNQLKKLKFKRLETILEI